MLSPVPFTRKSDNVYDSVKMMNFDEEDILLVLAVVDLVQRRKRNRYRVRPYFAKLQFSYLSRIQIMD